MATHSFDSEHGVDSRYIGDAIKSFNSPPGAPGFTFLKQIVFLLQFFSLLYHTKTPREINKTIYCFVSIIMYEQVV